MTPVELLRMENEGNLNDFLDSLYILAVKEIVRQLLTQTTNSGVEHPS